MTFIVVFGIFILTLLLNVAITPLPRAVRYVQAPATASLSVPYAGRQHVFAIDQSATNQISVVSFSLLSKGFLVITDEKTGELLGASHLLDSGLYGRGTISIAKSVTSGQTLNIAVYNDNGNGVLDVATSTDKTKDVSLIDKKDSATSSFIILGNEMKPAS